MSLKTRVSAYTLAVALVSSTGALAQQKAEVLHWWTSAGESAAVKVFADQFTKAGGTWVDNAIAGGANARTAGINRMVGGNPPTMMQFNTGKQFDELVSNDLVRDVESRHRPANGARSCPSRSSTRRSATASSMRFRSIFTARTGCSTIPRSSRMRASSRRRLFPRLIATGEKLKAKGIIPIALGGQPTWEHNLFRAVLVGHGGADMFRKLYGSARPESGEEIRSSRKPWRFSASCAGLSTRAARAGTGTTPPRS